MGANFQDVIRDVHDPSTHTLKTSGSSGGSGQATVTLAPSASFIGIVTVANPGSLNGNLTLDPGSRTGIVGNITLSDPKTFIGLTTTTLGASPAFIGIVTVANSQTNTGNVTLNASPNFIGLVTVVQSSSARTITGNLTLSDPKGFIGLVTAVGSFTANVANITLNPGPNYIGLVTAIMVTSASRATQANASITTTPVQLLGSDTTAIDTFVYNISNTTIFIANSTGACNASQGIPTFLNDTFSYSKFTGPVFAVTNAGSGEVRFWRSLL